MISAFTERLRLEEEARKAAEQLEKARCQLLSSYKASEEVIIKDER